MSRYVKIAALGPRPPLIPPELETTAKVDAMIDFWHSEFAQVLPDKPDLIVAPEVCDRLGPDDFPMDQQMQYYRARKNRVRDFFAATAKANKCYLVYSAYRELDDGTWRNSSIVLDRTGQIAGTYDKNHAMTAEHDEAGILCGKDAPVIECDFGTVACLICFDLNFADLRNTYAAARPDLLLFSSVYHGSDLVQGNWAYTCRSHLVGAVAGLPCQIRNPYGEALASSTNYRDYAIATVNLDCCLAHYDENANKFKALKSKYGTDVTIHDPGYFGSVLISSETDKISAFEMLQEFRIDNLDTYLAREQEISARYPV